MADAPQVLSKNGGKVLNLFDDEPIPLAIDGKTPYEVWMPYRIKL